MVCLAADGDDILTSDPGDLRVLADYVIDRFYTQAGGAKDWHGIWLAFALYALAMAVAFVLLFRYRHAPGAGAQVQRGHTALDVEAP